MDITMVDVLLQIVTINSGTILYMPVEFDIQLHFYKSN